MKCLLCGIRADPVVGSCPEKIIGNTGKTQGVRVGRHQGAAAYGCGAQPARTQKINGRERPPESCNGQRKTGST